MIAFNDDNDNVGIDDEESIIIDDEDNDRIVFDINIDDGSVVDDDNTTTVVVIRLKLKDTNKKKTMRHIGHSLTFKNFTLLLFCLLLPLSLGCFVFFCCILSGWAHLHEISSIAKKSKKRKY